MSIKRGIAFLNSPLWSVNSSFLKKLHVHCIFLIGVEWIYNVVLVNVFRSRSAILKLVHVGIDISFITTSLYRSLLSIDHVGENWSDFLL